MRWHIIAMLAVAMAFVVVATPYPLCEGKREIRGNCTMLTPQVTNCTAFDYTIVNLTGMQVENGTLQNFSYSNNIYQFNMTRGEGDYVVSLCDGTTREIRVIQEDDSKMILGMLIIAPLVLGFFFAIGAATMGSDHPLIRIFLFFLTIVCFFSSMHFGLVGVAEFYDVPALENLIASTTYWVGWVMFILISYFIIYAIIKAFNIMAHKKAERLEY